MSLSITVPSVIEESRYFIEWSVPDILPDRADDAARLVEIGRGLTHWHHNSPQVQSDAAERAKLAEEARAWSDQVLQMSGLLEQE